MEEYSAAKEIITLNQDIQYEEERLASMRAHISTEYLLEIAFSIRRLDILRNRLIILMAST